jgi:hypothetical protein
LKKWEHFKCPFLFQGTNSYKNKLEEKVMIKNKINSEFAAEINEVQFDDKKLYEVVLEIAKRIEKESFEVTEDLIREFINFFKKISENLKINYEKILETLNYVFEHSEVSQIETNDLVKGFHNVADVENEIYEYVDIYEEYIKTCNNLVTKFHELKK